MCVCVCVCVCSDTPCTYNEALKRLDSHFTPAVNVVAERYRFRQRGQRHDEPVDDYISSLRALSVNCEFGNLRDEFIRDQLVEKTNCGRIRERLLTVIEPKLTLMTAIPIARQMESAARENRALDASSIPVNALKFNPHQQKRPYKSAPRKNKPESTQHIKTVSTNTSTSGTSIGGGSGVTGGGGGDVSPPPLNFRWGIIPPPKFQCFFFACHPGAEVGVVYRGYPYPIM